MWNESFSAPDSGALWFVYNFGTDQLCRFVFFLIYCIYLRVRGITSVSRWNAGKQNPAIEHAFLRCHKWCRFSCLLGISNLHSAYFLPFYNFIEHLGALTWTSYKQWILPEFQCVIYLTTIWLVVNFQALCVHLVWYSILQCMLACFRVWKNQDKHTAEQYFETAG